MRFVIFEADDFGALYAFNEGIRAAFHQGQLNSTCLLANGFAYRHAIEDVLPSCPGLGIGAHLVLNEGPPIAARERVARLLNRDGALRRGFRWLIDMAQTSAGLAQIEIEFRAQIEKMLADGVRLDHFNSHQHVHMIPPIFRLMCRLAREYGIRSVRLTRELPYAAGTWRKRLQPWLNSNIVKRVLLNAYARLDELAAQRFGLATTDYFIGVNYTAQMSVSALLDGLRATPYGTVEVLLHPAIAPDPRDTHYPDPAVRRYATAKQRAMELRTLRSPRLAEFLAREDWKPMNFTTWSSQKTVEPLRTFEPPIEPHVRQAASAIELHCPPWVSEAQDDSRAFAELIASQTQPGQRVLDIGTGTGVAAITLARLGRDVVASDIMSAAVSTARANAERNGVKIECVTSDLLDNISGRFDLIAFNLPYGFGPDNIATAFAKHVLRRIPFIRRNSGLAMPRTVLRFHQQLVERLVRGAPAHLNAGGAVLLHAYESEVTSLARALPAGATMELLLHAGLTNRTVGMLFRLPHE
ncbi:MAG: ChbG/HpnK family deacetylase [Phycisphaerales bacterium]|nr:ChbG/HpnK family deacetylase [Phycisphaerales bacterium]